MHTSPQAPIDPGSSEQERLARAQRRVAAIKGFYIHLLVSVLVLTVLFVIDASGGRRWWVQWVLLGWGIAMAAHALVVFGQTARVVQAWERRKLEQFMSER